MFIKDVVKKEIEQVAEYNGEICLVTCVGLDYDFALLKPFMEYYNHQGVDKFFVVTQSSPPDWESIEEADKIISLYHSQIYGWLNPYHGLPRQHIANAVVAMHVDPDAWVISADVDEFHQYPISLRHLIGYMKKRNINYLMGEYRDRISENGGLPVLAGEQDLWELFPHQTSLTKNLLRTHYYKVVLHTTNVVVREGGHLVYQVIKDVKKPCNFFIPIHHFKWHSAVLPKLRERYEYMRKEKTGWRKWKRFLDHWDEHQKIMYEDYLISDTETDILIGRLPHNIQEND